MSTEQNQENPLEVLLDVKVLSNLNQEVLDDLTKVLSWEENLEWQEIVDSLLSIQETLESDPSLNSLTPEDSLPEELTTKLEALKDSVNSLAGSVNRQMALKIKRWYRLLKPKLQTRFSSGASDTGTITMSSMTAPTAMGVAGVSTRSQPIDELEELFQHKAYQKRTLNQSSTITFKGEGPPTTFKYDLPTTADFLVECKLYELNKIPLDQQNSETMWKHATFRTKFYGTLSEDLETYQQLRKMMFLLAQNIKAKAEEDENSDLYEGSRRKRRRTSKYD